jgi:hypothetical protein
MTSAEHLNYSKEEIEKFIYEQAKGIVKMHAWKIKPGEIHANNETVIDWINKNIKIIEDFDEKTKRAKG